MIKITCPFCKEKFTIRAVALEKEVARLQAENAELRAKMSRNNPDMGWFFDAINSVDKMRKVCDDKGRR